MGFKDHFSGHASSYARARPGYPDAMIDDIAERCAATDLAWDCGTGNGQAARQLARHFNKVIATDASAEQIAAAEAQAGIEYRVLAAEEAPSTAESIDLVTVAQALHWFDIPAFFSAVDVVLKPGGLLAVWSYRMCRINPAVDALVDKLYGPILDAYWPDERRLVEEQYTRINFPYSRQSVPEFSMRVQWSLDALMAYLASWSATQRYRQQERADPLELVSADLRQAWGEELEKSVVWPLTLIVCQK